MVIGHAILDPPQPQAQDLMETIQMAVSQTNKQQSGDQSLKMHIHWRMFFSSTFFVVVENY